MAKSSTIESKRIITYGYIDLSCCIEEKEFMESNFLNIFIWFVSYEYEDVLKICLKGSSQIGW